MACILGEIKILLNVLFIFCKVSGYTYFVCLITEQGRIRAPRVFYLFQMPQVFIRLRLIKRLRRRRIFECMNYLYKRFRVDVFRSPKLFSVLMVLCLTRNMQNRICCFRCIKIIMTCHSRKFINCLWQKINIR